MDRFKKQSAAQTAKIVKLQNTIAELKEVDAEATGVQKLKRALAKSKDELDAAEEEKDDWRRKFFTLEERFEALKSAPMSKGGSSSVNKKIEDSIKQGWKEKMEGLKSTYGEKLNKLKADQKAALAQKHAAYQKRLDELKTKQAEEMKAKDEDAKKKIKAAKQSEQEARNEAAEEKKTVAETKKQLKAEQVAEINKLKPEFSPILKQKEREVSDVRAEKAKVDESLRKTKHEVELINEANGKLMDSNSALERVIEQTRVKLSETDAELLVKKACLDDLEAVMEKAEIEGKTAIKKRLDKEGARWEIQFKKAEDLGFKLAGQQRTNFELRCMLNIRDGEIVVLKDEVVKVKEATDGLSERNQALEAEVAELREEISFVTPPSSDARHGPNPAPTAVSDETETGGVAEVCGNSKGSAGDAAKEESAVPGASAEQSSPMETDFDEATLIAEDLHGEITA